MPIPVPAETDDLATAAARFRYDPFGFVLWAYPWGQPGPLQHEKGPRAWQKKTLIRLGERLRAGPVNAFVAIKEAIASGHGPGKSALIVWLAQWAMGTFEDARGVITAGTGKQLETKTKPEFAKWFNLWIQKDWFDLKAESMRSVFPGHEDTWRVDLITWSEHNTDAFQGLHNKGKRIFVLFDEASGIATPVWEVTEGALTDAETEMIWFAMGNPVHPTGGFYDCFHRFRHRWGLTHIDSRDVEGTNKASLQQIVDDYGEDHDVARVRVKGLFPRASLLALIDREVVDLARVREATHNMTDPLILGIDHARGGDDNMVARFRRGLDARSIPATRVPGIAVKDSMVGASILANLIDRHKPDAIFGDATGIGGPINDRLRQLGYEVIDVNFGAKPADQRHANLGTHCWVKMRDWLYQGGAIDNDQYIYTDLTNRQYSHNRRDQLQLESKDEMKGRGEASPDDADALATTFAMPVAQKAIFDRPAAIEGFPGLLDGRAKHRRARVSASGLVTSATQDNVILEMPEVDD